MATEAIVERAMDGMPVLDYELTGHDSVTRATRPAAQPRLDRIADGAGELWTVERPHDEIADRAHRQFADLAQAT
jgi:hypothetical protein